MAERKDQSKPPAPVRRWTSATDVFPFGLAPLIILVLTVVSGLYLAAVELAGDDANVRAPEVTLWTFTRIHSDAYQKAMPAWDAAHPDTPVDVQLVHADAVTRRLRAAFWADLEVPDAVEVEITNAGSFFRGPPEDIGFVDLKPRLTAPDPEDPAHRPLIDRIVRSRLAPYTNRGHIYGLPHDVHPVMLAYRRDLFEQLGIDADALDTWDKFLAEARRVTNHTDRYMLNLSKSAAYSVEVFLFQRGGGYFDADGNLTMDDETAVETLKWYVPLVAGKGRVAADPGMFGPNFAQAMIDGYTLAFICPDWKSNSTEVDVPSLAGKMKLMPLPAFEPGGRRTSTWGGTMIGLTKKGAHQDEAWTLVRHLYMNRDDLGEFFRNTNILPPFKDAWTHPAFHEPRPYWSGQRLGDAYIALADQVPPQYGSPLLELAKGKMGEVVAACVARYDADGEDGFGAFVRERLKAAADEVRRQMTRNPF